MALVHADARRYQTLESDDYYSPFAIPRVISESEQKTRVSPINPVPKNINGMFNPEDPINATKMKRGMPENPLKTIPHTGLDYGPSSRGYASLRFYGTGPY